MKNSLQNLKKFDLIALVAVIFSIIGAIVGWVITVEKRMTESSMTDSFYSSQNDGIKSLEADLNSDIDHLRDRINHFKCPTCPQCLPPINKEKPQ